MNRARVRTQPRRPGYALLAALALGASACGASTVADEAEEAVEDTEASVTAVEEAPAPEAEEAVVAEALALPEGGPIEPGRYSTDLLGTTMDFDAGDGWALEVGRPAAVILAGPDAKTETSEVILIARMDSLGGADDVGTSRPGASLSGASSDLDAWIEAVGGLNITGDASENLGGAEVRELSFTVGGGGNPGIPGGCGPTPDDTCYFVGGTRSDALAFFIVRTSELYRMWFIDQGDEDPILILAIAAEGNEAFLDQSGELVSTMSFGEPAPHPVPVSEGPPWEAGRTSDIPAGTINVPALGGLSFELSEDRFVFQDGNFVAIHSNEEADGPVSPSMFVGLVAQRGLEMIPVTGVEDFVEVMKLSADVTEIDETIEVSGITLQGYQIVDGVQGDTNNMMSTAPAGEHSNELWLPGPLAVVYLGESPDLIGVVVIGYEAFTEEGLVAGKAVFDQVLPTLAIGG